MPLPSESDSESDESEEDTSKESVPRQIKLKKVQGSKAHCKYPREWRLPPAEVIVRPRNPIAFWQKIKAQALENENWELAEIIDTPLESPSRQRVTVSGDAPMAFPVVRGDPAAGQPDEYCSFSWKMVQELQRCAVQYSPNSPATIQMLSLLTMDELTPYDIQVIAQIIFLRSNFLSSSPLGLSEPMPKG
ncbi:hypothetical protein BTVI_91844 [Pitangus sulphuratus]|nr:hypothetical protein BTVI_91844 [Pitangus sulphuratus]